MNFCLILIFIILSLNISGCKKIVNIQELDYPVETTCFIGKDINQYNYKEYIKNIKNLCNEESCNFDEKLIKLNLINIYFRFQEFNSAIILINEVIKMYPDYKNIDNLLYIRSMINLNLYNQQIKKNLFADYNDYSLEHIKISLIDLQTLVNEFPQSKYFKYAQKYILFIKKEIANYELEIIKYYFKKNMYKTVINRAEQVISEFPEFSISYESMKYMEKSYRKLGFFRKADRILEIINK